MSGVDNLNYCESTGSLTRIYPYDPQIMLTGTLNLTHRATTPRRAKFYGAEGGTTEITESLTIKYFQRVYDIDNTQWCYYTKTSIDTTPGTSETTPTNSGNITSASIVQILEIY